MHSDNPVANTSMRLLKYVDLGCSRLLLAMAASAASPSKPSRGGMGQVMSGRCAIVFDHILMQRLLFGTVSDERSDGGLTAEGGEGVNGCIS